MSQLCRRLAVVRSQFRQRASSADGGNVEWHSDSLPSLRESYRRLPVVEILERDPDPIVEFEEAVAALTGLATAGSTPLLLLGQPVLWRAGLSPEEEAALWFTPATPSGPVRSEPAALALEMDRYNRVQEAIAENSE